MTREQVSGWVGECPGDIASFLRYSSKRAGWLHGFLADKDVVACREVEDLDDEFFRDICAWLYPPIRPRTHGQWVAVNSDGILTAVPLPDTPPSKRSTPISWAVRDNLLYVAKWANTVLTAFNYWLNSSGIGGYPVWEGYQFPPQVADLAGLAELPEIMRCQDFEHARANFQTRRRAFLPAVIMVPRDDHLANDSLGASEKKGVE